MLDFRDTLSSPLALALIGFIADFKYTGENRAYVSIGKIFYIQKI